MYDSIAAEYVAIALRVSMATANSSAVAKSTFGIVITPNAARYGRRSNAATRFGSIHGMNVAAMPPSAENATTVSVARNAPAKRPKRNGKCATGVVSTISRMRDSSSRSTAFDAKIATANSASSERNPNDSITRYGEFTATLSAPNPLATSAKPRRKKSAAEARNAGWRE